MRKKHIFQLAALVLSSLVVFCTAGWLYIPSPVQTVSVWPTSPAFFDRDGTLFHVRLSETEEYCLPIPLSAMGPWLPSLAVAVEDKRFYQHNGIDWLALGRAAVQNTLRGKRVSGASTLTSQLVRIAVQRPRTLWTKYIEFTQALKLERSLSKSQILEIYLNRAPFGGTLRGVEAAARSYFGKSAQQLSLAEAALLIGMLKGPTYYRPDRSAALCLERRNAILRDVTLTLELETNLLEQSLKEPLPDRAAGFPTEAWHFVENALYQGSTQSGHASPQSSRMHWPLGSAPRMTPLDQGVQTLLEKKLAAFLRDLPAAVTAAGTVMDNETGEILAYVGNSRFDKANGVHWTDCGTAHRSPGSILKPFIYAEAFRQGKIIPASLLADSPLLFSGSAPRNFDKIYRGPVSAQHALAYSLNAPAVRTLRMAGGESVLHYLRQMGFRLLRQSAAYYGDSLALGGCEVTLLEALGAYAGLATAQGPVPLTFQKESRDGTFPPVWSGTPLQKEQGSGLEQGVSYLVTRCLTTPGAVPRQYKEAMRKHNRIIAFKTGTSYGLRDAWAVGFTAKHSFGVWIGSPDNQHNDQLVGMSMAAPLLFSLALDLPGGQTGDWRERPQSIETFMACSLSGKPASPSCPEPIEEERIAGRSHTMPCAVHRESGNGLRTILPPELEEFALLHNLSFEARFRPEIVSPKGQARYLLNPLAPQQKIDIRAESAVYPVYWYINGTYLGEQKNAEAMLWPMRQGSFHLSLLDSAGRIAHTQFEVVPADDSSFLPLLLSP